MFYILKLVSNVYVYSYIIIAGGKTDDKEISTTEILEVGSNGFVKGPSMPDSQFNWGSTLISTLNKYFTPNNFSRYLIIRQKIMNIFFTNFAENSLSLLEDTK